jgi:hypothetical protein
MAFRVKTMRAAVAYMLIISSQLEANAYTSDGVVEASTGCTGLHNTTSPGTLVSEDEGTKLANRRLGRILLQDSSKLVTLIRLIRCNRT